MSAGLDPSMITRTVITWRMRWTVCVLRREHRSAAPMTRWRYRLNMPHPPWRRTAATGCGPLLPRGRSGLFGSALRLAAVNGARMLASAVEAGMFARP